MSMSFSMFGSALRGNLFSFFSLLVEERDPEMNEYDAVLIQMQQALLVKRRVRMKLVSYPQRLV